MPSTAEYMRRWRAARSESESNHRDRRRARNRALQRVADRYPGVFAAYYAEERAALGVPDVGMGGPGIPKRRLVEEAS